MNKFYTHKAVPIADVYESITFIFHVENNQRNMPELFLYIKACNLCMRQCEELLIT
jgi:hypothetical protein